MGPGGTDFQDSVAISVQRISLDGMLGHFDIWSLTFHALRAPLYWWMALTREGFVRCFLFWELVGIVE
jgi:hypothetical protein